MRHGQVVLLESHAANAAAINRLQDGFRQGAFRDLNTAVYLLLRLHGVPRIGKQDRRVVFEKQDGPVAAGEAGQVSNVMEIDDQKRVQFWLFQQDTAEDARRLSSAVIRG